jgi:hypothetical protein
MNIITMSIPEIKIIEPRVLGDVLAFFMSLFEQKDIVNCLV